MDSALQAIEKIQNSPKKRSFVVGFDGFTDEIVLCVDTRHSPHSYQPIATIEQFAARIGQASGKSTNIELVSTHTRVGGNAPLLAQALIETQNKVSLIATVGYPKAEDLFAQLLSRCEKALSIAPSGHTDALEFQDGKILLGKMHNVLHIDKELLLERVNPHELIQLIDNADIFASVNWTMISGMTGIWKHLEHEVFTKLSPKKRWMFVDLADPAKRTIHDLVEALYTLSSIQKHMDVALGLNEAEAKSVATALDIPTLSYQENSTEQAIKNYAQYIAEKLNISCVVIHATQCAACASSKKVYSLQGPYTEKPYTTTGGGDNFNAGFLLGLAHDVPYQTALLFAVATSGYYVRTGKSPTLQELYSFIECWKKSPEKLDSFRS